MKPVQPIEIRLLLFVDRRGRPCARVSRPDVPRAEYRVVDAEYAANLVHSAVELYAALAYAARPCVACEHRRPLAIGGHICNQDLAERETPEEGRPDWCPLP